MKAWMIGPFLITVNQLSLAIAFVITYFLLKTFFKVEEEIKDEVTSSLMTGLIIFLLSYKGLPLITKFADVIKNPFIIVYLSSGLKGLYFALIIMFIYLFIKAYRSQFPMIPWMRIAFVYLLTYFLSFWMMRTLYFLSY
ncbi:MULTISPECIES: hypothetical protein [Cytobacillus]|uniref:Yip1 domain-containing protein n=1 Tax=Cytobacillus stercorigallinarum TaxID=2762240 RepID=A0ABR8QLR9_9BACI|nr:hypothetical protein [Cytobacillus stercorigallinarum]MBD7936459.1 hypothetical protein [Cytobacillus stercorigallinarum]